MFVIDAVPEVTIPCRIVVVRVSWEFIVVDRNGCRCIDWCGGNISAAVDNRAAEIRPVIDRESNSYVAYCPDVTKTSANINLGITFGSD